MGHVRVVRRGIRTSYRARRQQSWASQAYSMVAKPARSRNGIETADEQQVSDLLHHLQRIREAPVQNASQTASTLLFISPVICLSTPSAAAATTVPLRRE